MKTNMRRYFQKTVRQHTAEILLVLALPVGTAASAAVVSVDGRAGNSGAVVCLPKGSAVAFSLKLDDAAAFGTGYTSGNGAVAQTGTVQRVAGGEAVYAVKAVGEPGESAGLYIDGEKVLEIKIANGAACPSCRRTDSAYVQVESGGWKADGETRPCAHYVYGDDAREEQDVYNVYTCTACGNTSRISTGPAYRWICHGSCGA